jgi:hypothetical protein
MRALRNFLGPLLFIFAVFIATELSLRYYYFGADAFSYSKMNSHTVIQDSGFVRRAANTDIYYELKPDLDVLFAGKRLVTNSKGLADTEYPYEKPPGVYRIVVVGSSWSMATAIELEYAWHSLIEQRLAEIEPDKTIEVINFSVEYYGLGEIVANLRDKAMAYDPDMAIIPITITTPAIIWDDEKEPFTPIEITPPFWQSLTYSTIMARLGKKVYAKTSRSNVTPGRGRYMRQVERAFKEAGELAATSNMDVAVLWLSHSVINETTERTARQRAESEGFTFIPVHLDAIAQKYQNDELFLTGRVGRHPNRLGHRYIADTVLRGIWGSGLNCIQDIDAYPDQR